MPLLLLQLPLLPLFCFLLLLLLLLLLTGYSVWLGLHLRCWYQLACEVGDEIQDAHLC